MIHGLLHGIRRCLLRVTQGFAARRRPGARRKRGGFMGRAGIDLFIEDGAYTTLSSAVVILVVLTLLFSSTAAIWSMSRAGDTQVAADSGALAGANVVSSYHTAATVVDASILSLGLAGFATIGTGLVAILIPGAEVVGSDIIDTGTQIIKTRNKFAKSAAKGLQKIETALPYLVAVRAMQAVSAQDTDGVTYTGTALAVPRTSESDFVALEGSEISTDAIKDASEDLERAAEELQKASEETAKAKERAWLADCGGSDKGSVGSCSCMWERAKSLTDLSGVQNPHYSSSVTWEPQVALDRAKDYYHWRLTNEKPQGSSVEMKAESAARKAFYTYASAELDRAYITENGDRVSSYIPLLPRNSDEVRATELYTDAVWPTSVNDGKAYLHYGTTCPNYKKGTPSGFASVADYDGQDKCSKCYFGVSSLGAVAAPSTSIENGFEYHFDKFKDALEDYVDCRLRSSVRPRTKPTVRAMRSIPPSKNYPVSVRASPRPVATAWSPLRFRALSPVPTSSTLRFTRQSSLAIVVQFLLQCSRPMMRRHKITFSRGFSRRWRSVRAALSACSTALWMFGVAYLWGTETSRVRPTSLWES